MKSNKILFSALLMLLCANFLHAEVLLFSQAYELALKNADDLKASTYLSESDKVKIRVEKSQLYPKINLSGYYRNSEYVTNPTKFVTRQSLFNYTLTFQQSLYNPEVYARINAQKSRSKYSQTKVALDKEVLAQDLFNAYLTLLNSKNSIQLYKSYLTFRESQLKEYTKKYELHLANKMDLLQVKVEYNSAKIDLKKEEKLFVGNALKLKSFIGDSSFSLPTINPEKEVTSLIENMRSKIKDVQASLEVKQAQIAVEISSAEVQSAKSAYYPSVNMSASYAKYDTGDPTIDAPYDNIKYAMVNVNIPIYNGGYVGATVDSARLLQKASHADLASTKKRVQVKYDEYLTLFDAAAESIEMYSEAYASAKLYVTSVEEAYAHGLKSIIDKNDAQSKLYEVQYKYTQNMYELVNAYIGLLIVTNSFDDVNILDKLVQ